MTQNRSAEDPEALASDPNTDWEILHWIAENYPELRPAVAANPSTYQELVDALGALGDPAVDAVIAARTPGREVSAEAAATSPMAGMWDTATGEVSGPAIQDYAAAQEAGGETEAAEAGTGGVDDGSEGTVPEAEEPEFGDPADEQQAEHDDAVAAAPAAPQPASPENPQSAEYLQSTEQPQRAEYPQRAEQTATEPPLYPEDQPAEPGTPAPYPVAGAFTEETAEREPSRLPAILAGVVSLGLLIAAVAVIINLFSGDDEDPVAEPTPDPAPTTEPEPEPEPGGEDETGGSDAGAIEAAQASVAALPEQSACETADDAGVIAEFLGVNTDTADFPGSEDTDLLEDALSGLQDECGTLHSAEVAAAVRTAEATAGNAAALNEINYGWVDRAAGDQGATVMSGFETPEGWQCEFGDGVRCTVEDPGYSVPDQCDGTMTWRLEADGTRNQDCEGGPVQLEDPEVLPFDQAASDGFVTCISMSDRISCYTTVGSVVGFEISETGEYAWP